MNVLPANLDTNKVDLIADSLANPLVVAFSKSNSPNYSAAVALAKLASKYSENTIGNSMMHMAAFAADRVQMSRALALLRYIKGLKSTQLYAGGKLLASAYRTEEVIDCYLTASACNDWRAHCHRYIRNPFAGGDERLRWTGNDLQMPTISTALGFPRLVNPKPEKFSQYRFPCKFLVRFGEIHFKLDSNSPVSAANQIQAMAVAQDCAWCPNFKPEDFTKT